MHSFAAKMLYERKMAEEKLKGILITHFNVLQRLEKHSIRPIVCKGTSVFMLEK